MGSSHATSVRVAVLGASGYAGGELLRLIDAHPGVDATFLGASGSSGKRLVDVHPHLASLPGAAMTLEPIETGAIAEAADVAICALPHGAAASHAPSLLEAGVRVIDLSGDFRLPAEAYPGWYGFEHPAPAWLGKAVYGLPELFGDRLGGAQLVANPGCFPTAVILGVAPLMAAGLVDPVRVVVDGKTGISGAGRATTDASSFAATDESIRPYRAPRHQHTPEMERGIEMAAGVAAPVLFVPHLVPAVRGVVTTSYLGLSEDVTTEQLTDVLAETYRGRPFVRVLVPGAMVDSKRVRGTNVVELGAIADKRSGTAVVVGALDNLVKGAAGQALQNLNLVLGLPEETGLPAAAGYP